MKVYARVGAAAVADPDSQKATRMRHTLLSKVRRRAARLRRQLSVREKLRLTHESALSSPSFRYKHLEAKRLRSLLPSHGAKDPLWAINPKDRGYQFAASHGISVPVIYQRCESPSQILWSNLPDSFVIKTVNGTSARGVIPLVRTGPDRYVDLLDVVAGTKSEADIVEHLENPENRVSRELLVEELLRSPYDDGSDLAPDVKLYCFYGQVGMIRVRGANGTRDATATTCRYFSSDGEDLGNALVYRDIDPTLPVPLHLAELVDAGERLSRALPTPFVRLDFFEQPDRVVFCEVTMSPGGNQSARPDIDARLGTMWETAEAQLRAQRINEGSFDVRFGEHSYDIFEDAKSAVR